MKRKETQHGALGGFSSINGRSINRDDPRDETLACNNVRDEVTIAACGNGGPRETCARLTKVCDAI